MSLFERYLTLSLNLSIVIGVLRELMLLLENVVISPHVGYENKV